MANRLIHETSPYLLQHAHNPVDWYPWGDEAFARARAEDRPVLLSIGYSACHWCHVMEHESFEDATTAELMNEHFVNIKVDREERPDLDQIYMTAVQGMTGQGGWPMTVFLTPERQPFYGGTYFPPTDRGGLPGFRRVLASVAEGFAGQRSDIDLTASRVTEFIRQQTLVTAPSAALDAAALDAAFESLAAQFDKTNGGFGRAPKFPQAMALEFLLRYHHRTGNERAREIVDTTLEKMARGGIYDQIGGGFHRYSVDGRWLVPHFEKMLYDNALLARTYLHAYQVTRSPLYRRIVEETLDYVRREMVHEEGGFFSTQDADSGGVEGSYYVWTPDEIRAVVGHADAPLVLDFLGVTETGNFEGKTILTGPSDETNLTARHGQTAREIADAMTRAQAQLLAARSMRVPPARDDKVLAAWNGLMLRTFAEAARALGRPEDRATAAANAEFLSSEMWRGGQLFRVHKDGKTRIAGYLDDYAGVADGLLALYESIHDLRCYTTARDIADAMAERFWDEASGCFFDTARDAEPLVARPRDIWDNATPSGTSLACGVLLKLWSFTGNQEYERLARSALTGLSELMQQHGTGMGNLLCALDYYLGPPFEVAVIGEPERADTAALVAVLHQHYLPNVAAAAARPHDVDAARAIPLLGGRGLVDGRAAAYVCRGFVCDLPTTEPNELLRQLGIE